MHARYRTVHSSTVRTLEVLTESLDTFFCSVPYMVHDQTNLALLNSLWSCRVVWQVLPIIPHAQVSYEPPNITIQPMPLFIIGGVWSTIPSHKIRRHIDNTWCTKAMQTFLATMKDRDVWNTEVSMHMPVGSLKR